MKNYQPKHTKANKTAFKIKKAILITITIIMAIIFFWSLASLDSEPFYIPLLTLIISGGWLVLMGWANGLIK